MEFIDLWFFALVFEFLQWGRKSGRRKASPHIITCRDRRPPALAGERVKSNKDDYKYKI